MRGVRVGFLFLIDLVVVVLRRYACCTRIVKM